MKRNAFMLCLMAMTILFSNCKKKEPIPKTNSDFILGTWLMTNATIDPPDFVSGSDLYTTMDDCEQDNLYTYESPSNLILDEAARKCVATALQSQVGSYSFDRTESILSISIDGKNKSVQIHELNNQTMIYAEQINFAGGNRIITYTFSKI